MRWPIPRSQSCAPGHRGWAYCRETLAASPSQAACRSAGYRAYGQCHQSHPPCLCSDQCFFPAVPLLWPRCTCAAAAGQRRGPGGSVQTTLLSATEVERLLRVRLRLFPPSLRLPHSSGRGPSDRDAPGQEQGTFRGGERPSAARLALAHRRRAAWVSCPCTLGGPPV